MKKCKFIKGIQLLDENIWYILKLKFLFDKVESMKGGKGVNVSGMDDLDKALEAEMKAQVEKTQVRIFNIFKMLFDQFCSKL